MAPDETLIAETRATVDQEFDIVLRPVSHPELGDIRISEALFAIGRTEAPFSSYAQDIVSVLSRRHARIFSEQGAAYIADLQSKNGTTVNGAAVMNQPARLRDGDEIAFGGTLSYRVELRPRAPGRAAIPRALTLTLTPVREDLGLQPIEIQAFPFLVSKADETFARYRQAYPHQVNYMSRRHAHFFQRGAALYIEDLGSTNGTSVNGRRLDEYAVPLADGDTLAFGGNHFVYRVGIREETQPGEATVTKVTPVSAPVPASTADAAPGSAPPPAPPPAAVAANVSSPDVPSPSPTPSASPSPPPTPAIDPDKTTFVAAAGSFLDIFCIDYPARQDDEINAEAARPSADETRDTDKPGPRSKFALFTRELLKAAGGGPRDNRQPLRWGLAGAAVVCVLAVVFHFSGASERKLKTLMTDGDYAEAAIVADRYLERHPRDDKVAATGTEAVLKARLPGWVREVRAGQFDRAAAALAGMKTLGRHNADLQPLLGQLGWLGDLQGFMAHRGGADAPIRIYADEPALKALLKPWQDDASTVQRNLVRVASYVPEFRDLYADALSNLRRLQSDDSVYLTAIDRLNATIAAELDKGRPEALYDVLRDYAERYPRLAGLDTVRRDLDQYRQILNLATTRSLGPLADVLAGVRFVTPPFQAQFAKLSANLLPSADVVKAYQAANRAWKAGNAQASLAALQSVASGPWAAEVSAERGRRKGVADRYTQLQAARGRKDYDESVLSFFGSLDAAQDTYYVHAVEADVAAYRDTAVKRAQDLMGRALDAWRQYRNNGGIGGEARLEAGISPKFRSQAALLAAAQASAAQGMRIFTQLKAEEAAQWEKVRDEIDSEAELQRRSLQELRMVLEPGLLKSKVALIGGKSDEERQSP